MLTRARTIKPGIAVLLCIATCGCGINITPPATDTSTGENGDDGGSAPVASNPGAPAMMPAPGGMSNPGASGGGHGSAPATPGADSYPGYNSAGSPGEAMHGADAAATDPALAADGHGLEDPAMSGVGLPGAPGRGAEVPGSVAVDPAALAGHGATPPGPAGFNPGGVPGAVPPGFNPGVSGAMHGAQPGAAGAQGGRPEFAVPNEAAGLDPAAGAAAEGFEGGRSGRASRFEEGTPPHVVMLLVEAIDAGDLETAAKYISDRADGQLASVRDGEAGENQLRELQSYFATMDPLSQRPRGRSITLNFRGGQSKVLSFVVGREGREFLVESLTVHDAPGR